MKNAFLILLIPSLVLQPNFVLAQTQDETPTVEEGQETVDGLSDSRREEIESQLSDQETQSAGSDESARGAASSEQGSNGQMAGMEGLMGAAFTAVGGGMMAFYPTFAPGKVIFVMGLVTTLAGVATSALGGSRDGNKEAFKPTGLGNIDIDTCKNDPLCKKGGGGKKGGGETKVTEKEEKERRILEDANAALAEAKNVAKKFGVDLDDPKALEKFKQANGLGGLSDAQIAAAGAAALSKLSPEQLEKINKAKAEALARFNVSSVDVEGGGGGRALAGGEGAAGAGAPDFSQFLKALNPEAGRAPASVDGLSKNVNGEPIGVASGNIFEQVSRRYQIKAKERPFLAPMVNRTYSSVRRK